MRNFLLAALFISFSTITNAQDTAAKKAPIIEKLIIADSPANEGLRVHDPAGQKNSIEDRPDYPHFPGGPDSLRKFIKANFQLPQSASNIRGREIIGFYVETDGTLSNIHITRGISPDLDKESIRVMSIGPKWQPALKDGKPIKILYAIPILFPL